ncbi:MAG TPA: hypothetical protein VHV83_06570 [Armatimonadota bacterium]|nr:hypothetical protein [Armatimonadota bacterium]
MKKYLIVPGILALVIGMVVLAGCGENKGWALRIIDTTGKPVPGAQVCVWSYPLSPRTPQKDADEMGKAWEHGDIPMHGYVFTSDKSGTVTCTGMPTGKMVVDRYSPGYYRTSYDPLGISVYRDRHGHRRIVYGSEWQEYVPPRYHEHLEKGDWLAVTVTAQGYKPYHFAFRPDLPHGDLGTVQLLSE